MIQPVSALSPRAGFRGLHKTYGNKKPQNEVYADTGTKVITAGGLVLSIAAFMLIVGRAYTDSWRGAGVIAAMFAGLSALLMLPKVFSDKLIPPKKAAEAIDTGLKKTPKSIKFVERAIKQPAKTIQFRQS